MLELGRPNLNGDPPPLSEWIRCPAIWPAMLKLRLAVAGGYGT